MSRLINNILFIVEGESSEKTLIRKFNKIIDEHAVYEIFSYKSSIHELHRIYEELHDDVEGVLTFLGLLKECATSSNEKRILSRDFRSIYLVFDFDPHYHKYDKEKVVEISEYFSDSRNNGMLLLNYPMIEAHRHLNKMPDFAFHSRCIDLADVGDYKKIVGKNSAYTNINAYNYPLLIDMISHHYTKLRHLSIGVLNIGTSDQYREGFTEWLSKLLTTQIQMIQNDSEVSVISTALFYVIDLMPITVIEQMKKHTSLL